jgi:hypothetical protein
MLTANDGTELAGQTLGPDSADLPQLRREVAVKLLEPSADFEPGAAYVLRSRPASEAAYLAIPVRNVGKTFLCFIEVIALRWVAADGTFLTDYDKGFITGSVGATGSARATPAWPRERAGTCSTSRSPVAASPSSRGSQRSSCASTPAPARGLGSTGA